MSWNRLQPNWISFKGLLSPFSKPVNLIFQSTVHLNSLFLRKPQLSSKVAILAGLSGSQSEAFRMSPLQLTRTRTIPRRVQCWALSRWSWIKFQPLWWIWTWTLSNFRLASQASDPVCLGSWSAGFAKPTKVTAGLLVPPGEVADLAVSTWRCPPG